MRRHRFMTPIFSGSSRTDKNAIRRIVRLLWFEHAPRIAT